jgi:hypothetical protein
MKVKKKVMVSAIFFLFMSVVIVLAQEAAQPGLANDSAAIAAISAPALDAASSQAQCTPTNNILTAGYSKARSAGSWIITRDYLSFAKNTASKFWALNIWLRLLAIFATVILIFIIWNNLIRDTRANNLRRARIHHLKGERAHQKGDEKKAAKHYEKARQYREKAQEQW